ncbi:MAG: hypothetical protein IJ965_03570, partial [Campylobacter sp.]|nr:hypothetical protein [Campylobacter sp.]
MIEYEGFKIEYSKKRVKYLRLKITKTGDIKLVAPLNASKFQIESFIRADDNHAAPSQRSEEEHISAPVLCNLSPGKVPRVSSN